MEKIFLYLQVSRGFVSGWTCSFRMQKGQFVVLCILLFFQDGVEMLPGLITPMPEWTNKHLTEVMVQSRKGIIQGQNLNLHRRRTKKIQSLAPQGRLKETGRSRFTKPGPGTLPGTISVSDSSGPFITSGHDRSSHLDRGRLCSVRWMPVRWMGQLS